MDGKRYISFLLISCFSVFLGHNLVPHHHHAEIVAIAINEPCPIDHDDHHDSDDHPIHCHAFNSLDFVKYSHSDLIQPIRPLSAFVVPDPKLQLEPDVTLEFQWYICKIVPDKSIDIHGANSLRAPPSYI